MMPLWGVAPFHEGARVGLIRRILARVNANAVWRAYHYLQRRGLEEKGEQTRKTKTHTTAKTQDAN
jgi:DNA-binding transcriptional regulator YhcF (GntR family)